MKMKRLIRPFVRALVLGLLLSPAFPQTPEQVTLLSKGATAPGFRVRGLEGQHLELAMFRGKVLVLNFWFIACPPCREEIPKLNSLVDLFAGQEVSFIAFGLDPSQQVKQFLAETQFRYTIVPSSTKVAMKYGVRGAPTHVVVDKAGKVHWIGYGALEDPEEELARIIKEVL